MNSNYPQLRDSTALSTFLQTMRFVSLLALKKATLTKCTAPIMQFRLPVQHCLLVCMCMCVYVCVCVCVCVCVMEWGFTIFNRSPD